MHTAERFQIVDATESVSYLPQYDLYGAVHKGLRWALSGLLTRLGACSAGDPGGVRAALDELDGVLQLFSAHAAHEDRHMHAALEARRPGSSASLGTTHVRLEHQTEELRTLASALASAAPEHAPALLRALYLRFATFAADLLAHMSEEEHVAQPLLEALYSPAELDRVHAALLSDIGPEEMFAFLRVMIAGANAEGRAALARNARAAMPAEAWSALLGALRRALSEPELSDLTERLRDAA